MRRLAQGPCSVIVVMVLLSVLLGCERPSEDRSDVPSEGVSTRIQGAGSSFAAPIFQRWLEIYGAATPGALP